MAPTACWHVAERGGHPQVGGAGVEEHQEVLRGGPDADLPEVRGLQTRGGLCPWDGAHLHLPAVHRIPAPCSNAGDPLTLKVTKWERD